MKDYEKNIVLFVYRFKIVLSTNIKYLLGNKKYYQVVVKRLVDKGYLRRYKTKYLMYRKFAYSLFKKSSKYLEQVHTNFKNIYCWFWKVYKRF